ncbi:phage regulatory CII family protein [Geopsychrobacter electrodiphilus]|uniref:phage regulatory CII family protein n=1 Tax=Geopsychrobacter electrodiphilus TaxID=225196 RepID=UPI00037EB256|nr:phage regulatory CII family protein [Geopsychrobacter electrodiphilus]
MESYEAMRRAVGGAAVKVARRLGRSSSMVQKWCEPSNDFTTSGALNPLDRIEGVIEVAVQERRRSCDAYAPIYFLAQRFGGLFLPPIPMTIKTSEISAQLCRTVKEAGDAFSVAAKALEDDNLSPNERREILKEAHEAMAAFAEFTRMIESEG